MKENVYKHLIITKTDVQDSVSVLRKTWKTIRCKVTRGKKRPGTHGIQIYRLRSRSHVRWRDFKPGGCSLCVFSLWGSSHYKSITSMHAKKYIYSVYKYFEFINCIYMYNIHFVFIAHRAGWFFLCHQLHFDIFTSVNPAESESHCNYITVDIKQDRLWKMLDAL